MSFRQIIPKAEPFFFPGTRAAVLLVHGFTGVPKEMRWMGEYLHHEHGLSVMGVRLAGHATQPRDMIRSRFQDWLACVEDGFAMLSGLTDNIFLAGLSMGGLLTLTAASYLPVKGVIAMSTPHRLPDDPRIPFIPLISHFMPYLPKSESGPGDGWFDREVSRQHIAYSQNPVRAIGELNKLMGEMRGSLARVTAPVLLIHSRDDDYVVKDSMPLIHASLGSMDKSMLWIEGSGHNIVCDARREVVFRAAAEFINKHTP